jgi:hypothetical protein
MKLTNNRIYVYWVLSIEKKKWRTRCLVIMSVLLIIVNNVSMCMCEFRCSLFIKQQKYDIIVACSRLLLFVIVILCLSEANVSSVFTCLFVTLPSVFSSKRSLYCLSVHVDVFIVCLLFSSLALSLSFVTNVSRFNPYHSACIVQLNVKQEKR